MEPKKLDIDTDKLAQMTLFLASGSTSDLISVSVGLQMGLELGSRYPGWAQYLLTQSNLKRPSSKMIEFLLNTYSVREHD